MKKAKVTMRNWEPYVYDGEYNLSGTADVHPRLGRNVYVATTSTLVKASLEEDVLIYETRNTVYHCPLKYMMVSPYGNVVQEYREELARLDTSENALDRLIAAAAKMSLGELEDTVDEMVRKICALQETGQQEIAQMEEQEKQRLIEIAGKYEDYEREIEELTEAYRQADQEKLAELIADKTAAYIASKGDALGLDCTPQVETQPREGVPYPSAVTLDIPEDAALAAWISEELAIDRAHQYWREADE